MDAKWCWEPEVGLLAPDAIIYLDMPIEDAAKRGEFGGERYEKVGRVANLILWFYVLRQNC